MEHKTMPHAMRIKRLEHDLNALPLPQRVKFLAQNYQRCLLLAKKHGLAMHKFEGEKGNESKNQ